MRILIALAFITLVCIADDVRESNYPGNQIVAGNRVPRLVKIGDEKTKDKVNDLIDNKGEQEKVKVNFLVYLWRPVDARAFCFAFMT